MDHLTIIKRAWNITWTYRVLWLFGFILALTSGGTRGGGGSNSGWRMPAPERFDMPNFNPDFLWRSLGGYANLIIALACALFLLAIFFTVLRYAAETAVIRMVDLRETSGEKLGFRAGWRLGWSRPAFRLFLIDLLLLIVILPLVVLFLALALVPLVGIFSSPSETVQVLSGVAVVGLLLLVVGMFILLAVAMGLLSPFFHRAAVLEGLGVVDSIRRGFAMVRRRLGDVLIMGILLFGVSLAVMIVTIPIVLILLLVGGLLGGLPAFAIYSLVGQSAAEMTAILAAAAVGIPVFLVVIALPLLFIGGLYEVFSSSTWTLVFREARALEGLLPGANPPAPLGPTAGSEGAAAVFETE